MCFDFVIICRWVKNPSTKWFIKEISKCTRLNRRLVETRWRRSVQFYPTICVCQLTQYSKTITTYTHNTRAHHSHTHITLTRTALTQSARAHRTLSSHKALVQSRARSHRTHTHNTCTQHSRTRSVHTHHSDTCCRTFIHIVQKFVLSGEHYTKKQCLKINFKTTTIFYIAFGMDCCMYLTSIARHSYSFTTVIKDATNDKSINDNMGKFWMDILTFWRTCFYTLVRSHVRTFCKDAQGLRSLDRLQTPFVERCQVSGIDEHDKYGHMLVTHDFPLEYEYSSDGVQGRSPTTQIELSLRFQNCFLYVCLLPVSNI